MSPMTNKGAAWLIGMLFEGGASLMGTVGKQMLRYAATTSNLWYYPAGFIFTCVFDPAFDVAGYSFAAASIITACSGLVVVWNVILAPRTLGEPLSFAHKSSSVLIFAGTVITGACGNHEEVERTVQQYMALFTRPVALAYVVLLLAALGLCLYRARTASRGQTLEGVRKGGAYVSALAGLLAGNTFTTKATIELVVCVSRGGQREGCESNPFHTAWPYLLMGCAMMTAVGSLVFLAVALRTCEALTAITIFEGCMIISGAFAGNLMLDEVSGQSIPALAGYAVGVGVILFGLAVLLLGELQGDHGELHDTLPG